MKPKKFNLDVINNGHGLLVCDNSKNIPYEYSRMFCVNSANGEKRGGHAHKTQSQTLICLKGKILVEYIYESEEHSIYLEPYEAYFMPPLTWATQQYLEEENILLVLCSSKYDPDDYIHDINIYNKIVNSETD